MKKGIKRQSHNFNGMHRIHISIPEREYQQIQEASSKMGISISMFINSYLKYGGFRELIALAKKIDNTPKSVHIVFDDEETSEQVTKLTAAMSSYSSQLRRIGTNLSSLIADIRDKKVALNNDDILSALESLEKSVKVLQLGYSKTAKEARDVFHSDRGITKTEYIERK